MQGVLQQRGISVKKLFLATRLFAAIIIAGVSTTAAQTTNKTPTPAPTRSGTATVTGPTNNVQGNVIICSDSTILDFNGTMLAGFDIEYQVFAGTTGTGTALTA